MNAATDWLNARPRTVRRNLLIGVGVAALAAVLTVSLAGLAAVAPFVGGVAGGVLYAVAFLGYLTVLSGEQQDRINLKKRYPLPGRRFLVFVFAAVWVIFLLLASRIVPPVLNPLVGTGNVFAVLALYVLLRQSPIEALDAVITGRRKMPRDGEDAADGGAISDDED